MGNGLEEMASAFDPRVRDLAARTRTLIVDVYPEAVEVPWPRQNVAGYGVGPRPRAAPAAGGGQGPPHFDPAWTVEPSRLCTS